MLLGRLLGLRHGAAKQRANELLDAFGLDDAAGRLMKGYSGGMRRRLDIGASLVVTPELMFLDEPTTGLDPRSRNQVWEIVRALAAEGTTVRLFTQCLDEADQLTERIAVIDHGRAIAEGSPSQLKASVGSGTTVGRRRGRRMSAGSTTRNDPIGGTDQAAVRRALSSASRAPRASAMSAGLAFG